MWVANLLPQMPIQMITYFIGIEYDSGGRLNNRNMQLITNKTVFYIIQPLLA